MALEEPRQAAILNYVNLMRIKAEETGENRELDYQIRVARVILSINEQIRKIAQSYPTKAKTSSNGTCLAPH